VAASFALARTPLGPDAFALRKRLAAGRRWLASELRAATPRLDDAWLPWLLAFGLGPAVDRWFGAHGGGRDLGAGGLGSFPGGGGGGGGRWTGGGGSFSGGGATGTWAALGAISSSIPAPSSSSSGGGGGGGGGSSGGGGGGGW
jgi:hypothetical protein